MDKQALYLDLELLAMMAKRQKYRYMVDNVKAAIIVVKIYSTKYENHTAAFPMCRIDLCRKDG